jgi:hypothetical protein
MRLIDPAKVIVQAGREVFVRPAYLALALAVATITFALLLWAPNFRLIATVFTTPDVALALKARLLLSLLAPAATSFDALALFNALAIPLLFGIDIALIAFFLRQRSAQLPRGEMAASVGGAATGVIVAGCAACGPFLLVTLLSLFGATGALALLPWRGGELGLLGVALLLLSIYLIARRIVASMFCELPRRDTTRNGDGS